MNEWMNGWMNISQNTLEEWMCLGMSGGAVVKWVRSLHTIVALLWESYGQTGEGGGFVEVGRGREEGTPKPSAAIMDINNIHTGLPWKLGSKG